MNRIVAARKALSIATLIGCCSALIAYNAEPQFRVIAFFTARKDPAHISFVTRNRWLIVVGGQNEEGTGNNVESVPQ